MTYAKAELENLFKSHRRHLIWKIFRMVSCHETAEELVNEAYTRIASAVRSRPVDHLPTFLYQTAHNLAIDHLRREQTRNRFVDIKDGEAAMAHVPSPDASPETIAADRQRLDRLAEALSTLPARTRTVLLLNRVDGMSYPEIARRLGVSESTVYKDVQLALSRCLSADQEA